MRCYQHFGLTSEAEVYLESQVNKIPKQTCPKCGEIISTKLEIVSTEEYDAFYGDGPLLATYKSKDGKLIKEIVQAMPWSSGPCGFICLELEDGTRIGEWEEDAINNC